MKTLLIALLCSVGWAAKPTAKVIIVGDSIAAGWNLETGKEPFPALLQKDLGSSTIINLGYSGDTSRDGLKRLPTYIAEHKPTHVVIALGVNDMWRGMAATETESHLQAAINLVKKAGASPILFGVGPFPGKIWPTAKDFPPMFERLESKNKVPLLKDYLKPVLGIPEFNQSDMLHPNGAGQQQIAKQALPFLRKALRSRAR